MRNSWRDKGEKKKKGERIEKREGEGLVEGKEEWRGQSKVSERGWRGRNVGSGGESRGYAEEKNE